MFPSREWCESAAVSLLRDPRVIAAIADFGPALWGLVLERGGGLASDFCLLARIEPGKAVQLSFPDDEDELEEYEPDYIGWVAYPICKALLQSARPDPLKAILDRKVRVKGDFERLVKHAGRHQGAGLDALRALPTEFV
jgi:hypothetical protein